MASGRHGDSRRRGLRTSSQNEYDSYRNGRVSKSTLVHDRLANGYKSGSGDYHDINQESRFSVTSKDQVLCQMHNRSTIVGGALVKSENGVHQAAHVKKRKLSPIQWNTMEKKAKISSNNTIMQCPSFMESGSEGSVITVCSPYSSLQLPQWKTMGDVQEDGKMDGDESMETPNILTSRWASDDSTIDSCFSDGEDMSKRKEMVLDKPQISSPESGEFLEEDEYTNGESDKNSDAEVDEKHNSYTFVSQSEALPEQDNDIDSNQEDLLPKRSINMLQSSRSVFDYEKLNKINEGTYGIVYRARDKQTGEIVALKKIKLGVERDGGFPLSSLREINILLSFHHPSIVNVKEVVMGDLDSVFLVMEYMEHDLKAMMDVMKHPFSSSEVKCLMLQLLEGVKYLHDNWVLHRDLKSSNLLMNNMGELKLCDFGMSRQYSSPLKPYTSLVVTLWYRAPELLLGTKQYSTAIDMWSVGCIMAEMLSKEPLFQGKSEVDQLDKIFRTLGTPNEMIWPGLSKLPGSAAKFVNQPCNQLRKKFPAVSFSGSPVLSETGFDLLSKLLTYNPDERITVDEALNHPWFSDVPLPKHKDFMPTFPAQNERDRCHKR